MSKRKAAGTSSFPETELTFIEVVESRSSRTSRRVYNEDMENIPPTTPKKSAKTTGLPNLLFDC
jgi:hypothetical protein